MVMNPTKSFVVCFYGLDGAQRSIAFLSNSIVLSDKNVALIYSVTICEQRKRTVNSQRDFNMNSSGFVVYRLS